MKDILFILALISDKKLKPNDFTVFFFIYVNCRKYGVCVLNNDRVTSEIPVSMTRCKINRSIDTLLAHGLITCDNYLENSRVFHVNAHCVNLPRC